MVNGFGGAMLGWPLTPELTCSTFPPASRTALVCSSLDRDVLAAAGSFFLLVLVSGLVAILGL